LHKVFFGVLTTGSRFSFSQNMCPGLAIDMNNAGSLGLHRSMFLHGVPRSS
jgi:hypothetical protein